MVLLMRFILGWTIHRCSESKTVAERLQYSCCCSCSKKQNKNTGSKTKNRLL